MDEVAENSESLMERYLEGEEISHEEIVTALEDGTDHGLIFPVTCGVATAHLGADRLLDAIVDDLPSPVQHGGLELEDMTLEPTEDGEMFAYVFKTRADPYAGRINLFRVYQGTMTHDTQVLNCRSHHKERIGQLLMPQGKEVTHADSFGPGDIGAVAKLKETRAGDWLAERDQAITMPSIKLPAPVMAFAIEPKAKGDEDKVFTALRRLQEEDPTIDLHRDQQTGEQIVAGLSQIHVEVIVDRMRSRFGAEVELKPPRVPYQETIRGSAKAHGRHKKQTGGRGQFGDCHIEIEPLPSGDGFEFVNAIKGGVIPTGFIPAVEKGVLDAMQQGAVAGYPIKGVRVRLFDGSYHTVDSSEMAFKLAGSLAMKQALEQAQPGAAGADHARDGLGAGRIRRRRDGRSLLAARPPARHRGGRRHDRGQGRGPDGGDALLRARPALDHGRPGRVHARLRPLRGGARAPGPEGHRGGAGGRGRQLALSRPSARPGVARLGRASMARTRDIRTNQTDVACDICGRTLLRGEHAEGFLAAGQRRQVCELCTARAQHEGWIRESGGDDLALRHTRFDGRGRSFIDRLRTRRDRARDVQEEIVGRRDGPRRAAAGAPAARSANASSRPSPWPRRRAARATFAPSRPTPT